MCEDGTITIKGLRDNAGIIDEMLFDVNTTYFEERGAESLCGGYEYAKEFFSKAYDYAVKEAGGEEYILSAVMHADERNREVSERLGKDVYHYHLHVMYVPVVQEEVKWSKRCKDISLIGTVKGVITQVSHSKKWASHKAIGEDGKPYFEKSYSLLQDRFFEHMRDSGYRDIHRGEKGSTDKHKSTIQHKVDQEEKRLQGIVSKVEKGKKSLEKVVDKKTKIKAVNEVETKPATFNKGKLVIDEQDFVELKAIAKKQIATESREKKLLLEIKQIKQQYNPLHHEYSQIKTELSQYTSIKSKLYADNDKMRISELEKIVDVFMKFLDFMGLREKFEQFKKSISKQRNEVQK